MVRRKQEPSLVKIVIVVLVLGGVGFGVVRFTRWLNEDYLAGIVEASAPAHIEEAAGLIAEGREAEARQLLEPIVDRVSNPTMVVEALLLLAEMEAQAGRADQALEYLKRATYDYPGAKEQPRAAVAYAEALEEAGRTREGVQVFKQVRESAPPHLRAPALVGLGRQAERDGDLVAARDLYRRAVEDAAWGSRAWDEAADALGAVNVTLIFSATPTPESKEYTVRPGDNLTSIGVELNTTLGLLMRANGIDDPTRLRPGDRLKYTPKDFRIVIERSACRLYLLDDEGLFKRYPLGLGMEGHETTLGSYRIGNKQKNPTWFKPGEGAIPPGDPRNELGTRWMPLVPDEDGLPTDLGIHGTIEPATIGAYASHGCPRMLSADVEELYDLVVRSTPVEIVEVYRVEGGG